MGTLAAIDSCSAAGAALAQPRRAKSGWFRDLMRSIMIARAEQALRSLSDHVLAQAGIARAEIPELARRIHDGFDKA
jgi:uncharacterized protein YjiS (DUF1127 family)